MDQSNKGCVKKISSVNLDKLISDFSQIEKKIMETSGKNNILNIQLEKTNILLKALQTKEASVKEECITLHNMVKGLQQTIEYQHNLKDENEQLKINDEIMKEKLKSRELEYNNNTVKLMGEMKAKEEEYKKEIEKLYQDMQKKVEFYEEKQKELIAKKDIEISELNAKLRTQEQEKQNEILKLQVEFDAKLTTIQVKSKSNPDSTALAHSIYKKKFQHLLEEKNKEISILRNTIHDLQQRLSSMRDSRLKSTDKDAYVKRKRL
ncbi:coiled-coil domain-containing protein 152 [Suncus etruscus]|uniref:coiled-coil domain-containing protein 152 n=1 Tax=Suncus etruscus TaxID=109475 RepID=UPI0021101385|nr:coiled-coil domain-containing protein 152 [Suncus etruscus]